MVARVGKPAPDFEAMAFQNGNFKLVKLSDYKGHWLLSAFIPAISPLFDRPNWSAVAVRYEELQART